MVYTRIISKIALLLIASGVQLCGAQVGGGRDGYVVWERIDGNSIRIYKANLDGTGRVGMDGAAGTAMQGPVISTDGKRIAYTKCSDNGKEYPAKGKNLEVWVMNRNGSNRRKVFDNARDAGENRMLRWIDAKHLAIPTAGGTYRVYIPESGNGEIRAGTLPGGRQTDDNGLIVKRWDNKYSVLPSPSGNKAYYGDGGKGYVWEINSNYELVQRVRLGGCQAFVSFDDMHGVGAEYQQMDNSAKFKSETSTGLANKGVYDGTTTNGKDYDYFPTIGNDNTVGAICKSEGQHSHRGGNYDVFVFNLKEQGGRLRPDGSRVNVSQSSKTDRWPDVWVSTSGSTTVTAPSITVKDASNITENAARLNAEIIDNGGEAPDTVHVYWGTSDGEGDANAWDHKDTELGPMGEGTFYYDVSGLEPATNYYYSFWVQNSAGGVRSTTASFETYADGTVSTPASIVITPASATIAPNGSVSFEVEVFDLNGTPMDESVVWAVDSGGFIDQGGTFTSDGTPGSITVTATASNNDEVTGTATVVVTDIPLEGMSVWFRADRGITTASDNTVERWEDFSGNGNHATQEDASLRPQLIAGGYNNNDVVRFGGGTHLDFPQITASPFTVFVVFKISHLTDDLLQWMLSGIGPDNENNGYHVGSLDTSGFPTFLAFDGTCMAEDAPPLVGEFRHLVSVDDALYFDGVKVRLATSIPFAYHRDNVGTLTSITLSRMGAYVKGNNSFNGDIAEVIVYNRKMGDTERSTVTHYLNEKYKVAPVTVLSPNGGESFKPGEEILIKWKAGSVTNVRLLYMTNNGLTKNPICAVKKEDTLWGHTPWVVPDVKCTDCRIRIEDYSEGNTFDVSDSVFTIEGTSSASIVNITKIPDQLSLHVDKGVMYFSGAAAAQKLHVEIFDMMGVRITNHTVPAGTKNVILPDIGAGRYFVHIRHAGQQALFPIIIRK